MARVRKNVASQGIFLVVYDEDGGLALPAAITVADILYDDGSGAMVAASGTLSPRTKPLVVPDFTFTTTHGTDTVNATAHGRSTGEGPFRLTTSGTLPAGYALDTDYWWIKTDANSGQFASSLANALAGTAVAISSNGSGTHTISDTALTRACMDGQFRYVFTQAEANSSHPYISITCDKTGYRKAEQTAEPFVYAHDEDAGVGGPTYGDLARGSMAILAGPVLDFETNTYVWLDPWTAVVRWTGTVSDNGRTASTPGTLT